MTPKHLHPPRSPQGPHRLHCAYPAATAPPPQPEECTICLEPIGPCSRIGEVQVCRHYYHDHCVVQWAQHSNSCPTCRSQFHKIHILAENKLVAVHSAQDKLLATEAINDIPAEFVIPAASYPAASDPYEVTGGVCAICSSSDYRLTDVMACQGCSTVFHPSCLGLSRDPASWCCPMCDYQQLYVPPRQQRRPPARRRLVVEPDVSPKRSPTRPTSGLVIHNDNGEIDDAFLYDTAPAPRYSPPIVNGGVLLRKEMKQLENLSAEELKAWEMFENVRNNKLSESEVRVDQTARSTRRKRKKLSQVQHVACVSNPPGHTRLSSLMSEIRQSHYGAPGSQKLEPMASYESSSNSPSSGSPSSLSNFSPHSVDDDSETDRRYSSVEACQPRERLDINRRTVLTFEQKSKIQTLIRDTLRPLYKPKATSSSDSAIRSEEDYININKSASRRIYSQITESADSDESSAQFIEDFIGDDTKLKLLVDKFVSNELERYAGDQCIIPTTSR